MGSFLIFYLYHNYRRLRWSCMIYQLKSNISLYPEAGLKIASFLIPALLANSSIRRYLSGSTYTSLKVLLLPGVTKGIWGKYELAIFPYLGALTFILGGSVMGLWFSPRGSELMHIISYVSWSIHVSYHQCPGEVVERIRQTVIWMHWVRYPWQPPTSRFSSSLYDQHPSYSSWGKLY